MRRSRYILLTLFLLIAGFGAYIVYSGDPANTDRVIKGYEAVSLVEIIAHPQKYDGKQILVIGFVTLGFEQDAIWLHKDDAIQMISKNALSLSLHPMPREAYGLDLQPHYATICGVFKAHDKTKILSIYSGDIVEIDSLVFSPHKPEQHKSQ